MKSLIKAEQVSLSELEKLFNEAEYWLKVGTFVNHYPKIMTTLFYEPSTRTRLSFESAMIRLGGKVLSCESAFDNSSNKKGESLEDTIRTISCYCDLIVLRHPSNDSAERAAKVSSVPVINAGSGSMEHPTQAMIDLYTVWKKFKRIDDLKYLIVGDIKQSRTIHSLFHFLSLLKNSQIVTISPETGNLENSIKDADVVYLTRMQSERGFSWSDYSSCCLKFDNVKMMKKDAIILHPLPRNEELPEEIDECEQAHYFKQVKNGLYLRMALIEEILCRRRTLQTIGF